MEPFISGVLNNELRKQKAINETRIVNLKDTEIFRSNYAYNYYRSGQV